MTQDREHDTALKINSFCKIDETYSYYYVYYYYY